MSSDYEDEDDDSGLLAESKTSLGLRVQISGTQTEEFLNEYKYILSNKDHSSWELSDEEFESLDEEYEYQACVLTRYFIAMRSKGFTALYFTF